MNEATTTTEEHSNVSFLFSSFMMFEMKRGPRYEAYSQLRETKLRMNHLIQQQYHQQEEYQTVLPKIPTPPRKQVKFQPGLSSGRKKGSSTSASFSHLAQSVPDFSAAFRKENRKPVRNELTPPPALKGKTFSKGAVCGVLSNSRGSQSANAGEKKSRGGGGGGGGGGGIFTARKSYANIHELRSFSSATENSEIRGRNGRVVGKRTILSCREL